MTNKINLFPLLVAILLVVAFLSLQDKSLLKQVQAGNKALACEFKDGWRTVQPGLVVDFIDGVWIFENGHAKNCEAR